MKSLFEEMTKYFGAHVKDLREEIKEGYQAINRLEQKSIDIMTKFDECLE